jgi:hypothetical protein
MAEWRKLANLIYARTCAADRADSRPGALLETLEDAARFMRLAAAWSLIFASDGPSLATRLPGWMREGRLKQKEDVAVGLENAPKTLLRLFASQNFGNSRVTSFPRPKPPVACDRRPIEGSAFQAPPVAPGNSYPDRSRFQSNTTGALRSPRR